LALVLLMLALRKKKKMGLVFVSSCNEEIAQFIFVLMNRSGAELAEPIIRLLPVALGLLYLGKQESVEATAEVQRTLSPCHSDCFLLSTIALAGLVTVLHACLEFP
jgi:hypothetical protein